MDASRQQPINSGYGAATTTTEVLAGRDLSGVTAIVTGGYSGLGLAAARALAAAGAEVIVPARSEARAKETLAPYPELVPEVLDLLDPESIDEFAERFLATGKPLHLLINSAGVVLPGLVRDARGYEGQFSTNHLGHFQLTALLWPALRRAKGARVIAVSSRGHMFAGVDFDDPNFERRPYDIWLSYGQSKSANNLFALELDRRGRGDGVRAFSVHPGTIYTGLGRDLGLEAFRNAGLLDDQNRPVIDTERGLKSPEQGAATIVWCATSPQLDGLGGVYCEDCDVAVALPADAPKTGPGVRPWSIDPDLGLRLWNLSEKLTGVGT